MPLTLEQLNNASREDAAQMLDGLYEHSPWIAEQALAQRPFTSLAHLKHAMCVVLERAGRDAQLGLIRAHRSSPARPWSAKRSPPNPPTNRPRRV